MQDNDGVIKTDIVIFNTHLGDSLVEVINMEHCQCECKVKTEDGERIVSISLRIHYIHHELKN